MSRTALREVFQTGVRASILAVLIDANPEALQAAEIARLIVYEDGPARSTVHRHLRPLVEDTPLVERVTDGEGYAKYRLADTEAAALLEQFEVALIESLEDRGEQATAVDDFFER